MMPRGNHTTVTEFILTGFPGLHPQYEGLASAALLAVYALTMVGNATVIYLFLTDRALHKPPCYIIVNLAACDALFSTTTLPKIISKYWLAAGGVPFTACFVQMYLVHYLGTVNSYVLFLMALDRYLAVCRPLRYHAVLKNSTLRALAAAAWVLANGGPLMMVVRAYPLPYCASNRIHHCFCDHIGITRLACTDRAPYALPAFVFAMLALLAPLAFIVFSYGSIMAAALRMASRQSGLKALSTCAPQLMVIALYYLPRCFVYLAANVGIVFSPDVRIVTIMLYSLAPPMINPLIYCWRVRDMRESLRKRFIKTFVPLKSQVSTISS